MDGCIVMRSGFKTFDGKVLAHGSRNIAFAKHVENMSVVGRVADERYTFMVLCRGTDEGHTADVYVFDGVGVGDIRFGNRLLKRIEIHGNEVNIIPAEVQQLSRPVSN